jgi:O-antigen/teichoic acid export membrane protein
MDVLLSKKRIGSNLFYLLVGGTVATVFEFIIAIWLARRLTDEGFGLWSFVESVVINFAIVVDAGLSIYGVREIARQKERLSEFVVNILAIRSLLGLLMYVLFGVLLFLLPMTTEMRILLLGGALWVFPQAVNPEFVFQGLERMAGVAIWRILSFFFYLVFVLSLVQQRTDLWSVPYFKAAAALLTAVVIWPNIRRYLVFPLSRQLAAEKWPSYLQVSLVMAASILVVKVFFTFDTLMLGLMGAPRAVGWYNAAYKIVLQFVGLVMIVQFVFGPVLARLKDQPEELNRTMQQYNALSILMAGIFCGVIFTSSPILIRWLYGSNYSHSVAALRLLTISLYFVFVQKVFMTPLMYGGYERLYLLIVIIGTAANIALNSFLIPLFSYTGAAVATIISNAVITLLSMFYYGRHFQIRPLFGPLLGSTLIFVVSLGIASLISLGPLLSMCLFIALFCAVMMKFYAKTIEDLFHFMFGLFEHPTGRE